MVKQKLGEENLTALEKYYSIAADFVSWRACLEGADSVCIVMIRQYLQMYRRLCDICPPLVEYKPAIVAAFENRPLQNSLLLYMVATMIGMLYVAFVYVYLPTM